MDDQSNGISSENESLKWSEVVRGISDIRMWLSALAYFGILAGLYSFGLFVCVNLRNRTKVPVLIQLVRFSFPLSLTAGSRRMPILRSCGRSFHTLSPQSSPVSRVFFLEEG